MLRPGSTVADGLAWSFLTAFSMTPSRRLASPSAGPVRLLRSVSLMFAWLCLLMLALGTRPVLAADTTQCAPADKYFTVASGASHLIDLSHCSVFGLIDNNPTPAHGTITGLDYNGNGLATYTNNGDGATSDFFTLLDDMGDEVRFTVTITPSTSPIAVSPAVLATPAIGVPFNTQLSASGGVAPYTYSTTDTLPAGLSLAANGVISGTPRASDSFDFDVKVTDSTPGTPLSTTKRYSVTIAYATLIIAPELTQGVVLQAYNHQFSTSGGTAPYTYMVESGNLPPGTSVSASGLMAGTPTAIGDYSFVLKATDQTGGHGPYSITRPFTVKITAVPQPPVAGPGTATLSANSSANGITLVLSGGVPSSVAVATAASHGVATASGTTISYTPNAGFAGSDSFTYTATNMAGTSSPATVTITVNPVAPLAPAIGAATAGSGQASVSFTAPSNNGGSPVTGYTVTSTPGNFTGSGSVSPITVSGLANGTAYTFTATATNAVGTSSPSAASSSITPSAAPVISAVSPNRGVSTGGTSVTITGSGFTTATNVKFGSTSATGITVVSDTQITATSPAGTGAGTVDITVVTPGGTSATSAADQFTYLTVPVVTSLSPTSGPSGGGTTVTISGSDFSGATAVRFGATHATGVTVNSPTQITATAPAGTGTIDVRVTTAGGTSATSVADQFTYIGAPAITGISPSAGPSGGGNSVTITGTNLSGAMAVRFGSANASSFTVNNATQITATAPAGMGTVDITVITAGGTSATSAADQYTYVATPAIGSLSSSSGPATGGTTVVITGSNFIGATAVKFGASAAIAFTVNSATQITATAPPGTGTVDVTVTTNVGTSGPNPVGRFTFIGTPMVSGISPSTGPVGGGTTVTINGTNLGGAIAVRFGGANATGFTVNSATQITATAPAGSGTVDITVTTTGGTSATGAADQFTYVAIPVISSLSPTSGTANGGTNVVITGSGFNGTTAVTFGGTAATGFTVNSSTQITATAPAGTGTVDVRVTTAGGTSSTSAADQFTYVAAPTVSSLSPTAGPTGGGTNVVIAGSGFSGTTAVTFGGTAATGFTVHSASQITATAPAGTGTVDVRVTTAGGTSATSAADQFTYVGTPTVASLSPGSGPTAGGTQVTLSGSGFSGATAVTFGATAATGFTVNSATRITATAPAGTGTAHVTVTTSGGTSTTSAASQYLYADVAVGPVTATVAYGSSATSIALDFKGGTPTSVAVDSNPAHGTATASGTGISYTPTAGFAGTDSFTYTATTAGITSSPATVSITVSPPTQTVVATSSWTATRGQFYTQTLTWSGGKAPYSNYTALGLPSGLSISNPTATSAVISGTPTQAGNFTVTASARDSSTGDGPFTQQATFPLVVNTASGLTLAPGATTFNATSGTAFSQTFTASGGLAPYTFAQSGTLPAGVTWNAATATLNGEPTESGDFSFTVTASDASTGTPETYTQSYVLKVANVVPVAPTLSVNSAGPGEPVVINLTSNAIGAPFISANLVSMVPANAGTATISAVGAGAARMRMFAAAPGNNYSLRFVPNPDVSGVVTLTYTLSNASSISSPGVITISLSSRSDPSKDAEVQGLINAQANSSRRFASGQISNFQQRLEALHAGNVSTFSNGFTLTSASLQRQRKRQSLDDDPTGIEQWMQLQSAKLQSEQSLRLNPTTKPTQALGLKSVSDLAPELGNQSADAPTSPLAFWTSGTISMGDDANGKSGQSQDFVTSGLSVGADYRLAPNLTVGLGLGYGHDKTDIGDNGSRSQADSYSLALYGSYRPFENVYLDGVLGYQRLTFDNRRYVTDNAGIVNGDRDGSQTFLSLAAGYEYRQENWMLSPYARLDLAHATLDKYRERGDDLYALSYDQQTVKTTSTSLGLRSQYAQATDFGILTPSLRVEYQHDFQGAGDAAMRYADVIGDGALYHVKLDALGQDRGVFGLGLGLLTESNFSLNVEYQYTLSSGAQKAQSMLFNLRKPF